MKLSVFIILNVLTASAFAADYKATAIYCNGPVESGDVANCPSFSTWQGVSLKDLRFVSLPIISGDSLIQLGDAAGNTWVQPLETCKSKLSDLRGCNAEVDLSKPKQKSIRVSIWDIRVPQKNLTLFVDNQNQLSINSTEGDFLMFSLTEK